MSKTRRSRLVIMRDHMRVELDALQICCMYINRLGTLAP